MTARIYTLAELQRRRDRLERRRAHLQRRIDDETARSPEFDIAECKALQTAIVLFDEAIRTREVHPSPACDASLRAQALALLSTPAAATASDIDTHRALARLLDARPTGAPASCPECKDLEAGIWRRHAEIELGDDDAVRTAPDQQLRHALTQKIEHLAHALNVLAELAAAGDIDGVRMHFEHLCGAMPDLSVDRQEVSRG